MELFKDVTSYAKDSKTLAPTADNLYSASVQCNPVRAKIDQLLDIINIELYGAY